jgi:hypothetical protein
MSLTSKESKVARKTDEELLAEATALDRAYAEADAFDAERSEERKLDAYGHLTWTLGDDDWMACFDAIRLDGSIAYHVVVNCESGGWIDTLEHGIIPLDEAGWLVELPSKYVDSAIENHLDARGKRERVGRLAYRGCEKRWARHIRQLLKEKGEPAPEPADEMGELRKAALNRGQP